MSGIFLTVVYGLWIIIDLVLVILIYRYWLPTRWWSSVLGVTLFFVLIPLPLIDEIIAKPQFEKLCQEKASQIVIDAKQTQGRMVALVVQRTETSLGTIKIWQAKWAFVDTKTKELIYHYYDLGADGGWFIHALGISEGNVPLLFRGSCQPKNIQLIDTELGLTYIDHFAKH